MLQCNYRDKEIDLKNVPPFYVRLLEFWEVTHLAGKGHLSPSETIIWNNKHIKINNTSVFFLTWFRTRLNKIKDLMNDNGKLLPFEVFCRRFDVKACLTTYYGLSNSIRQNCNNISKESRDLVDLIANWHTNNSNLSTATRYRISLTVNLCHLHHSKKFLIPAKEIYQRYIFYLG